MDLELAVAAYRINSFHRDTLMPAVDTQGTRVPTGYL